MNARIAFAEAEVLRLRASKGDQSKFKKSGILDARKIYPDKITEMSRWKKWSARVLRWARMESPTLHAALLAAMKSRKEAIAHDLGDEAVFFWAHFETLIKDSEAADILNHVKDEVAVEAWSWTAGKTPRPLSPRAIG